MRDCEWIGVQLAADNVRSRAERRAARIERLSRMLHAGRSRRRTVPVLVDARRG